MFVKDVEGTIWNLSKARCFGVTKNGEKLWVCSGREDGELDYIEGGRFKKGKDMMRLIEDRLKHQPRMKEILDL